MRCTGCDAENMEGADRCWECGASLREADKRPSQGSWIIWVVLGVAALGIVVMLLASGSRGGGGSAGAGTGSVAATRSAGATGSAPATVAPGVSGTGSPAATPKP